ncbi:MAG TPA: carboxypeptidase-like regulatory domain-containing protein [Kofleriaceae bacterium]|nr:carboxypeptidase-like regulatory domain-containing protein [Kofleriaceae bacterium]
MNKRKLALVAIAIAIGFHVCHRTVQQVVISAHGSDVVVGDKSLLLRLATRLVDLDWDDDPFQIAGLVTDHDHQPVAGATVTLDGAHTATTAADGSFAFENVDVGDHTITAEKGDDYGETAGEDNHPTIELRGGPAVVLHVVDENGDPIAGAKVWGYAIVERSAGADGAVHLRGLGFDSILLNVDATGYAQTLATVPLGDDLRRTIDQRVVMQRAVPIGGIVIDEDDKPVAHAFVWIGGAGTQTDVDGTWRLLPGVAPGKRMLVANASGFAQRAMQEVEIETATPRMDLVIHLNRGGETITGVVVDASGAPVPHPTIWVNRVERDKGFRPSAVDSDGRGGFAIRGLSPNTYDIRASSATLGAPVQTVTIERGRRVELRFVLTQPAAISGIVVDDLGQPAAGVTVTPHEVGTTAVSDAAGHFQLSGLTEGTYALETWRYLDLEDRTAHVTARTGDENVHVVSPRPGALTGRVVMDGRPVDYFGMTLTDETTKRGELVPIHDQDGRFTKTQLGQRVFSVSVSGPGFEPKVLAHVQVKPGEQLDLGDIAVASGRVLRGRVIDRSGMPIADAAVVARTDSVIDAAVTLANDRDRRPGARTDSAGRFELAGLPEDISGYQIQASTAGALAPPRELSPGDLDRDIELVLDASGSIAGRLVDESGRPSHGASSVALATTTAPVREYVAAVGEDATFSLAPLPTGDYLASLPPLHAAPIAVHIGAGAITTVALTVPSQRVAVDVEVVNATCATIEVSSPLADDAASRPIVSAGCSDGHHAAFDLAPGEYKLCAGAACVVAEVAPGPRAQVTINATSAE